MRSCNTPVLDPHRAVALAVDVGTDGRPASTRTRNPSPGGTRTLQDGNGPPRKHLVGNTDDGHESVTWNRSVIGIGVTGNHSYALASPRPSQRRCDRRARRMTRRSRPTSSRRAIRRGEKDALRCVFSLPRVKALYRIRAEAENLTAVASNLQKGLEAVLDRVPDE